MQIMAEASCGRKMDHEPVAESYGKRADEVTALVNDVPTCGQPGRRVARTGPGPTCVRSSGSAKVHYMHGLEVVFDAMMGRLSWDEAAVHLASPETWHPDAEPWTGRWPKPVDGSRAFHGGRRELRLRAVDVAGADGDQRWRALHRELWPAYRAWFLRPGGPARPDVDEARRRLRIHMPELVPTWERLADLAGGDDTAARMLAMYNPPPFVSGCSQAALGVDRPGLVRNYDYDEHLFEGVVLASRFGGRRVIGTNDQLWGLLDGMNDDGLAISLAFGGRRAVGDGFGVPLILRYVLETCGTLVEARAALARLPVQLSYNILVVDREGRALTAYINPDRPAHFSDAPATTNHQKRVEWPEHDRLTRSVARALRLRALLAERPYNPDRVVEAFLRPPLRSTAYSSSTGTLYTAEYRPARGRVTYRWPGSTWSHSLDGVAEGTHVATLTDGPDEDRPGWAAWSATSSTAACSPPRSSSPTTCRS